MKFTSTLQGLVSRAYSCEIIIIIKVISKITIYPFFLARYESTAQPQTIEYLLKSGIGKDRPPLWFDGARYQDAKTKIPSATDELPSLFSLADIGGLKKKLRTVVDLGVKGRFLKNLWNVEHEYLSGRKWLRQ